MSGDGSDDLGPMADRFDPPDVEVSDGETSSAEADTPSQADEPDSADNADNVDNSGQETKSDSSSGNTRRERPHTAIYVSEDLLEQVEDRFRTLKAELMLDGKEGLEKHRHFYEGLLEAGLENEDLDDIVLDKYEE